MTLDLNKFIYKIDQPIIFKNILSKTDQKNTASGWNFQNLAQIFQSETFEFRIGKSRTNVSKSS